MVSTVPRKRAQKNTRTDILELSVPLFAKHGYDGVSMRDLAQIVGVQQAALYHHFPSKEQLYFDAVAHEFGKKAQVLNELVHSGSDPWVRLRHFLSSLARFVTDDKNLLRLMQWIQLDWDETRQRALAEYVFKDLFQSVHDLIRAIAPNENAYQISISIFALVLFPFQIGGVRFLMPGHDASSDNPEEWAEHVYGLMRSVLAGQAG